MNNSELAEQTFIEGYNCSQSVLSSMHNVTGISIDDSMRLASGFGGGMGRAQHVCGAVTGGILVLNLLYGTGLETDKEQREELYGKIRQLIDTFEEQNQTINCRELLDGCNLMSPEGQERFKSENMSLQCKKYVSSVVKILEGII